MDEFLLSVGVSFAIAGIVTPIADYGFGQSWNFFVIWLIIFLAFWGILIVDGDWF